MCATAVRRLGVCIQVDKEREKLAANAASRSLDKVDESKELVEEGVPADSGTAV